MLQRHLQVGDFERLEKVFSHFLSGSSKNQLIHLIRQICYKKGKTQLQDQHTCHDRLYFKTVCISSDSDSSPLQERLWFMSLQTVTLMVWWYGAHAESDRLLLDFDSGREFFCQLEPHWYILHLILGCINLLAVWSEVWGRALPKGDESHYGQLPSWSSGMMLTQNIRVWGSIPSWGTEFFCPSKHIYYIYDHVSLAI